MAKFEDAVIEDVAQDEYKNAAQRALEHLSNTD